MSYDVVNTGTYDNTKDNTNDNAKYEMG